MVLVKEGLGGTGVNVFVTVGVAVKQGRLTVTGGFEVLVPPVKPTLAVLVIVVHSFPHQ